MSFLINIISIIITFGVIVFVHEFGHFIFAKMNHIKVNEFAIGMGPAIAKWTKKDTDYSVRALPIGGYCLMEGLGEASESRNAYNNKSVPARLSVSLAGPFFNFILAFLLAIIICHNSVIDPPVLTKVIKDSAAAEAGFKKGDEIIMLNGKRIYNYREITLYSMSTDPKEPTEFTYARNGQRYTAKLTRKKNKDGQYLFGFYSVGRESEGFIEEVKFAALEVRLQVKTVIVSLKMLVTGKASKDSLMGPVGIGNTMNDIIEEAKEQTKDESKWDQFLVVMLNIINFAVLLSANLGVMNLLPVPALDGGRILFVLIEGISGKPVPPEKEMIVNAVGVVLLMLLMIFVFFNDLGNLFNK